MSRLPLLSLLLSFGCNVGSGVPPITPTPGDDDSSPPAEDCSNGIDDDGDGATDCDDADCFNAPVCVPTTELCANGIDDDGDGFVDCADTDCALEPACFGGVENCTNGIDDDGNGLIDCQDLMCFLDPACAIPENCTNGIDDDGDFLTDCQDPDCFNDPSCATPSGFGTQLSGTITLEAVWNISDCDACNPGNAVCGTTTQDTFTLSGLSEALEDCELSYGCFKDWATTWTLLYESGAWDWTTFTGYPSMGVVPGANGTDYMTIGYDPNALTPGWYIITEDNGVPGAWSTPTTSPAGWFGFTDPSCNLVTAQLRWLGNYTTN